MTKVLGISLINDYLLKLLLYLGNKPEHFSFCFKSSVYFRLFSNYSHCRNPYDEDGRNVPIFVDFFVWEAKSST